MVFSILIKKLLSLKELLLLAVFSLSIGSNSQVVSPDGNHLAFSVSRKDKGDGEYVKRYSTLIIYDLVKNEFQSIGLKRDLYNHFIYKDTSTLLLYGHDYDGHLVLEEYDIKTNEIKILSRDIALYSLETVHLSDDKSKLIIVEEKSNVVKRIDLNTFEVLNNVEFSKLSSNKEDKQTAISKDGNLFAMALGYQGYLVLDMISGKHKTYKLKGFEGSIKNVSFISGDKLLLAHSWSGSSNVTVVNPANGKISQALNYGSSEKGKVVSAEMDIKSGMILISYQSDAIVVSQGKQTNYDTDYNSGAELNVKNNCFISSSGINVQIQRIGGENLFAAKQSKELKYDVYYYDMGEGLSRHREMAYDFIDHSTHLGNIEKDHDVTIIITEDDYEDKEFVMFNSKGDYFGEPTILQFLPALFNPSDSESFELVSPSLLSTVSNRMDLLNIVIPIVERLDKESINNPLVKLIIPLENDDINFFIDYTKSPFLRSRNLLLMGDMAKIYHSHLVSSYNEGLDSLSLVEAKKIQSILDDYFFQMKHMNIYNSFNYEVFSADENKEKYQESLEKLNQFVKENEVVEEKEEVLEEDVVVKKAVVLPYYSYYAIFKDSRGSIYAVFVEIDKAKGSSSNIMSYCRNKAKEFVGSGYSISDEEVFKGKSVDDVKRAVAKKVTWSKFRVLRYNNMN